MREKKIDSTDKQTEKLQTAVGIFEQIRTRHVTMTVLQARIKRLKLDKKKLTKQNLIFQFVALQLHIPCNRKKKKQNG